MNYTAEIAHKVYSAAVTERALHQSAAPMQYGAGSISATHVVGLKVFAFYSSKGGTGKTTLAANFAYELNRQGVRTLLMGADEVHPKTCPTTSACSSSSSAPNSMNYYSQVKTYLGQYEQAYVYAEEGRRIAQSMEAQYYVVRAITWAGMSLLGQGRYQAAYQTLEEATATFRKIDAVQAELGWSLPFLGFAALAIRQVSQAKRLICESLQIGDRTNGFFPQIFAVPAAALLLADTGEKERAVEIYALALRYPFVANSRWFEDMAGQYIAAAAATLLPEVVAAAQARGRARDLQATVRELLAELEGPGATNASKSSDEC